MKRIPADGRIKQLEKEKQKAIEDGNNNLRNKIQRTINKYVHDIRSEVFGGLKQNSRDFWAVIKSIRGPKDDCKMTIDSKFGSDLSDYFGRFNSSRDKDTSISPLPAACHFPLLNVNEVSKQFQKVKNGVACGSDGLPWWVFKFFHTELAPVYTYIFQGSILKSDIPCLWKNALTTPVPKVKIPSCVNDFRPIDLGSIAFNSLQKILLPKLMDYIEKVGDDM
ncbi:LINE-1 reverse transcriptase-like [Holothuria leucospilota]|uniref:LINE-1 reverse transcriptase-like n=1 Tax=Holothuria leucospilota TaxID=206669 RepID=A0A9Q1BIP3_HOLLE|nr:LINE-1 reverse transcriptase-like [Holothuria leucospilota]